MENGQYNTSWAQIHMMPEEVAQATMNLQAKMLLPVHCGKFALSHTIGKILLNVFIQLVKINHITAHSTIRRNCIS